MYFTPIYSSEYISVLLIITLLVQILFVHCRFKKISSTELVKAHFNFNFFSHAKWPHQCSRSSALKLADEMCRVQSSVTLVNISHLDFFVVFSKSLINRDSIPFRPGFLVQTTRLILRCNQPVTRRTMFSQIISITVLLHTLYLIYKTGRIISHFLFKIKTSKCFAD